MHNVLPNTIKYRLQTWTPEHWKTHFKDKSREKVVKVIDFLRQLPKESHLFNYAERAIQALSCPPSSDREKEPLNIRQAVGYGDLERVKELLASGGDANEVVDGTPLLFYAISKGHLEIVRCLLDNGAEINEPFFGITPLITACQKKQVSIVELLLEKKADISLCGSCNPLLIACLDQEVEIVRALLKFGANPNSIDKIDSKTALHKVMAGQSGEIVQLLLEAGANPNTLMKGSLKTPLHLACEYGNTDFVKLLLSRGANAKSKDINGNTPLHYAKNKETAELLFKSGASLDACNDDGQTPLLYSLSEQDQIHSDEELGIFLIEKGANIRLTYQKKGALYYAFIQHSYRIAEKLTEKGADLREVFIEVKGIELLKSRERISFLEKQNYDFSYLIRNKDLLFKIINARVIEIAQIALEKLIKEKADLNVCNEKGNTALHLINPERGYLKAEMLINAGADLTIKNKQGQTAFENAYRLYQLKPLPEILKFILLFLEKEPSLLDTVKFDEKTLQALMQMACKDNEEKVVLKLLDMKVRVDIQDSKKFTALDYALVQGHIDLLKKIIDRLGGSYKTFIEHKLLGHVFNSPGFSNFTTFQVNHEGFNVNLSAEMLALLGGEFLKDRPELHSLFEVLEEAPKAMKCSPDELIKKIENGKAVIRFTGWDTHIVALIFYKDIILKCNRGSGAPINEVGIEIFKMQNKENLFQILSNLQKYSTSDKGNTLLYSQMNQALGLEKIGNILLKKHSFGTCGWSNAKAAFLGAAYLFYLDQGLPEDKALVQGMRLFKEFTPFVREKVAEYCVNNTPLLDNF